MFPLPEGALLKLAPYFVFALVLAGVGIYIEVLRVENARMSVTISSQAQRIGTLQSANETCVADVKTQNGRIDAWLTAGTALAGKQQASIEAAGRASQGLMDRAKEILAMPRPVNPADDCKTAESRIDAEISRKGAKP